MPNDTKPLTLDEVTAILSDIARNGEGAERFRALKMIAAQETGSVTLPEPISDNEVVQRLGRLILAAGVHAVHLAYHWAFPHAKLEIGEASPTVTIEDLNPRGKPWPSNVKQLYRQYPEIKRSGLPNGYPSGGDLFAVKLFCTKKAKELEIGRKQREIDAATEARNAEIPVVPEPTG